MADTTETAQPDPVLRFRLRTLLQATTALAVLAAIAGFYYRSIDAEAQRRLLVFWLTLLPCTAAAFFWRLREAWAPGLRTNGRFVVYATNGKLRKRRFATRAFVVVALLGCYASASCNLVANPKQSSTREVGESIYAGLFVAFMTSATLMAFVRRPVFITERGIPLSTRDFLPWH